jgi:predicted ATPase
MRIRELILNNVRSFRGEHRISFVDPLTDQARPLTVIAGTNGTGKTTIFEAIEETIRFLSELDIRRLPLLSEVQKSGLVILTLEFSKPDLGDPGPVLPNSLQVAIGRSDLLPQNFEPTTFQHLYSVLTPASGQIQQSGSSSFGFSQLFSVRDQLAHIVNRMQAGEEELYGGLIYLPQERRLSPSQINVRIQAPSLNRDWISHLNSPQDWNDSLEGFWVWQNYLDLEERAEGNGHSHLKSFVETVETALGEGRKITVKEGRALIPVAWSSNGGDVPKVRLDQLPSGEQQVLLLLGELARRRRPGAVILIDEPETSLHPTLQRLLMHQLRQFARDWDAQLVVATHSMEILRAAHESQRLFLDQIEPTEVAETDAEKAE